MLVGIARMAAEAPLLESKRAVAYRQIAAKSWLNRCDSDRVPFRWTINPYRGCEFACRYCYARYTHEFLELSPEDFDDRIFAKQWDRQAFASELRRVPREQAIGIGTATDPYQPAERRYQLTRRLLEVFAQDWGRSLFLTTKSDLVGRDADVLAEIARRNQLHVSLTVTTMDARLARLLEPRAPRPDLRMAAVRQLASAGVAVGVGASPVMPGINDTEESLRRVAKACAEAGGVAFHASPLFLKDGSREIFFQLLDAEFPELARAYRRTYAKAAYLQGAYPERLAERVRQIRAEAGLSARQPIRRTLQSPQLTLFDAA